MDDLIDRIAGPDHKARWQQTYRNLTYEQWLEDELTAALKPVEDAELERMIFHIGDVENHITADERNHYVGLIERLARENEVLTFVNGDLRKLVDENNRLQDRIEELEERERVLLHNMNAIHQNITWIARLSEPVHPPQEDD